MSPLLTVPEAQPAARLSLEASMAAMTQKTVDPSQTPKAPLQTGGAAKPHQSPPDPTRARHIPPRPAKTGRPRRNPVRSGASPTQKTETEDNPVNLSNCQIPWLCPYLPQV